MIDAASGGCIAIVPYRERPTAKSRLAVELRPLQRIALARHLLAGVLRALTACRDIAQVLVVGDTAPDHAWSGEAVSGEPDQHRRAVEHLPSPEPLNAAIQTAAAEATRRGAREVLVAHADLPRLDDGKVAWVIAAGRQLAGAKRAAIASCQRGDGTNVLWLSPPGPFEFSYGAGSYGRHLRLLTDAGYSLVEMPAEPDIDNLEDLQRLLPGVLP